MYESNTDTFVVDDGKGESYSLSEKDFYDLLNSFVSKFK
jgi:hypothetical protein